MVRLILFVLSVFPLCLMAQTLTLRECVDMARQNYPSAKQHRLIEQTRDFTLENAAKGWLPQVGITIGGYAFTDVLNEDGTIGKSGVDMKNYLASGSVSISQKIYDGGQIASRKKMIKAQADVDRRQLDVSLYQVEERVEDIFFGILLLEEQINQNNLLQSDINVSRNATLSRMKNGLANESDLNLIDVEMLKVRQQKESLESSRKAYMRMLAVFIGSQQNADLRLQKPGYANVAEWNGSLEARPETDYYNAQNRLASIKSKQLDVDLMPKISLFATGITHTNVSDMVNNNMIFGGITLNWNIGSLYTRKNDRRNIALKLSEIENERETFLFNSHLQYEQTAGSLSALHRQIALDNDIVSLRDRIREQSEKKVALGTESTSELLRNINNASQARLQKVSHELELLRETYRLKHINNR